MYVLCNMRNLWSHTGYAYGMYFSCCGLAWLIQGALWHSWKYAQGHVFHACHSPLQVSSNRTVIFQNIVVDGFVRKSGIPKSTSPKSINIPFPSHSHPFPHVSGPIRATSTDHLDTPHFCGLFTLGAERPSCASTDGKSLWMMDVSIKHTTKISVILSIHQYILLYNIHDNKIYNNDTTMTIVCSGSMYIKRESLTLVTNRIMDPRDPQRRSASFHVL